MGDDWISKYEEPVKKRAFELSRQAQVLLDSHLPDRFSEIIERLEGAIADLDFSLKYDHNPSYYLHATASILESSRPHIYVSCEDSQYRRSLTLQVPEGESTIELVFDLGGYQKLKRYMIPPTYKVGQEDLREWFESLIYGVGEWRGGEAYIIKEIKEKRKGLFHRLLHPD